MITEPFSYSHKIVSCATITAGASGSSDVTGTTIDMAGFEHICFIVMWGAITTGGAQSVKAQRGDASDLSDAADLKGTSITVADNYDNKITTLDVLRPGKRYVRVVIGRATQASITAAIAVLYGASVKPVTQPSDVTGEVHIDQIEGTA